MYKRQLEDILQLPDLDDVPGSARRARECLAEVLSRPAHASAHQISAIGQAHTDSAWPWPLRETRRQRSRTHSNRMALSEEAPQSLCRGAVLLPLCAGHIADLEFRLLSPLAGARHAVLPGYVRHAEPLVALFARCLGLLNTTHAPPTGSPHASLNAHSVSRKHVLPFLAAHEHLQLELSVGDKLGAMTLRETLALQLTGNRIRVCHGSP